MPGVSLINKDNGPVVLHMPDDSTNCLINCPSSLLPVPILTRKCLYIRIRFPITEPTVKVILLEDDLWICHLRVRDPDHDHTAGCII